ncbi:MAG: dTMP kinase [Conchiformibius sp.]|nr:dTMP kinase [Conchiformibius sp.]
MKAKLITLDGIDGAGKTTQLEVIRQWFAAHGLPVLFTREPGGTALGETLRGLLLDAQGRVSLKTETLLMFAARQQHLDEVILPALAAGTHVVCDRFTDASYAYQGSGRGLGAEAVAVLEQWVQGGLRPDLTLVLDVPLATALARLNAGRDKDRFEREDAAFFARVRDTYLQRAAAEPQRCVVVDSSRSKETVKAQIEAVLAERFQAG